MEWTKIRFIYKSLTFWWIIGIFIGVILGIILRCSVTLTPRIIYLIGFVGVMFARLMTLVSAPFIASFLSSAICNLDEAISLRMGLMYLCYFCAMVLGSACLGAAFAAFMPIKPSEEFHSPKPNVAIEDDFFDIGRNLFPRNLLEMFVSTYKTNLLPNENQSDIRKWDFDHSSVMVDRSNILGIATVSIVLGFAIRSLGSNGFPLIVVVQQLAKFSELLLTWILYMAPICFVSMMAQEVASFNVNDLVKETGWYLLAVLCCHCFQILITFPALYFLFIRGNPLRIYHYKLMTTALATGSSIATFPQAMKYFQDVEGYDSRIVSFVLSVGINTNKLGSVEAYVIAAIFIGTWNGMELQLYHYITIILLSIAASIATPGVPFAMVIVLASVLEGTGIPADEILIFSMEFIVDRFTTVVNVLGNFLALAIVQRYNNIPETVLKEMNLEEEEEIEDKNRIVE